VREKTNREKVNDQPAVCRCADGASLAAAVAVQPVSNSNEISGRIKSTEMAAINRLYVSAQWQQQWQQKSLCGETAPMGNNREVTINCLSVVVQRQQYGEVKLWKRQHLSGCLLLLRSGNWGGM